MISIALPRLALTRAVGVSWLTVRSIVVFVVVALLTLAGLDQVVLRTPVLVANLPLPDYPRGKVLLPHM